MADIITAGGETEAATVVMPPDEPTPVAVVPVLPPSSTTGGTDDHGSLNGLGDDDHEQYALADGTRGDFDPVGAAAAVAAMLGTAAGLDVEDVQQLVDTAVSAVVDAAPNTLNTLNEIAAALGDDPNFATTITNLIAAKVTGPASSVSDRIVTFDGTTGKLVKDGGYTVSQILTAITGVATAAQDALDAAVAAAETVTRNTPFVYVWSLGDDTYVPASGDVTDEPLVGQPREFRDQPGGPHDPAAEGFTLVDDLDDWTFVA